METSQTDETTKPTEGIFFGAGTYSDVRLEGNVIRGVQTTEVSNPTRVQYVRDNIPAIPIDVRSLKAETGNEGYHDGTNTNTVGPAFYDGGAAAWKSLVDGTTIS